MERYINPLTDFGFKWLFGTEPNKDLLLDFLNQLLPAHHQIKLKDQHCQVFYDKLTYIYIELPKFKKTETELETRFDKWLYVLRYLSQLQDRPEALQERVFEKLFQAAEIAKFNKEERVQYEKSVKYYRDIKNVVDTSHEEGREEGREEERMEVAQRGIAEGYPFEMIAKMTGLSEDEIRELTKS